MAAITPAHDLFDLKGEVALVTGASSGLGARFAEVLSAHGARVVLAARRVDRIEALARRLGKAIAVSLDVTRPETFATAFDSVEQALGPVTLLINNAGIVRVEPFIAASKDNFDSVIATNMTAVWHLSQEFTRRLDNKNRPGSIINIASILGYRVERNVASYSVSKAAVVQMTQAMAVDLASHGIRVNAIAPGYIRSEMTEAFLDSEAGQAMIRKIPQRRAGDPSDLDGALLLLASRKAGGFITGSTIVVDGGHMWSFG